MLGKKRNAEEEPPSAKGRCRKKARPEGPTSTRRITRQMVVDGPRQAVLATTELLENILGFLPPTTLFGCLRVSQKFKNVITASILLQRRMGLKPSGNERQLWMVELDPNTGSRISAAFTRLESTATSSPPEMAVLPVELSFLLRSPNWGGRMATNSAYRSYARSGTEVAYTKLTSRLTGVQSWHRSFLTDPPTTTAMISLDWQIRGYARGTIAREVTEPAGITFGALIDAVLGQPDGVYKSFWYHGRDLRNSGDNQETTLGEILEELERKHGRRAVITEAHITLKGVVVPTAAEWQQMK